MHLPNQAVHILEFSLVANPRDEVHPEGLSVNVTVEVKEVHFNRKRFAGEGRLRAEVRDPRDHISCQTCQDRVDSLGRDEFCIGLEVRRWKAEGLASSISADDGPHDAIIPPEKVRGFLDSPCLDEFPNTGTADLLTPES